MCAGMSSSKKWKQSFYYLGPDERPAQVSDGSKLLRRLSPLWLFS
jgi:hypothetical protein